MPMAPSRSPTPTICKALGLQRSGSKSKGSDTGQAKYLNKSWAQVWGVENVDASRKTDQNASSVIGVGDGLNEKRTRRSKKEEEEWSPEIRQKSRTRDPQNNKETLKNPDDDAVLVLEELKKNKPRTVSRRRSRSVDKSKQRDQGRSKSPQSRQGNERHERRSRDKNRKKDLEEAKSDQNKGNVEKSRSRSGKDDRAAVAVDLFTPTRTRSREKSATGESNEAHKSKPSAEEAVLPRITRASSKDTNRTNAENKEKDDNLATESQSEKSLKDQHRTDPKNNYKARTCKEKNPGRK